MCLDVESCAWWPLLTMSVFLLVFFLYVNSVTSTSVNSLWNCIAIKMLYLLPESMVAFWECWLKNQQRKKYAVHITLRYLYINNIYHHDSFFKKKISFNSWVINAQTQTPKTFPKHGNISGLSWKKKDIFLFNFKKGLVESLTI